MGINVSRKWWVSMIATVGLLGLVWAVGAALAQEPGLETEAIPPGDVRLGASVASKINYQGRLTDPGGAPLNGTFDMRFQIYDDQTSGTLLWDSGVMAVDVDHGLFNVELAVDQADFDGQELWLMIYVEGDWLSPRQELVAVPYALSLRPGATVRGDLPSSAVLYVELEGFHTSGKAISGSVATGSAVRGEATGGYGVVGVSADNHGVYGSSSDKAGVYGSSSALPTYYNLYTPGVYGSSQNGAGVYGRGVNAGYRGVGVFGQGEGGPGGKFMTYTGNIIEGWQDVLGNHLILERRFKVDTDGDVYADRAYYCGLSTGCFNSGTGADVAERIDATEALEPGDVVEIDPDNPGHFRKAATPLSSTVAGVVSANPAVTMGNAFDPESDQWNDDRPLLALVGIVTVKASAENGPIQPGDLLASSMIPGYAMRAGANPPVGTVIGKALEPLEAGTGAIQMLVTLQ
ncbi:MAG: hypothetical protein GTO63_24770 [Anaerolineae bacterium]|nr:hypothetical protein [Anaerolineae bacterium]NIN97940.1 hypothetical protein [Anaerolineae bacterium]NIQ80907.1 hypothetical protein [Anaerolineae bacterium]